MADNTRQYQSAISYAKSLRLQLNNRSFDPEDDARLQSYALYEDFYLNNPDSFELILARCEEGQQKLFIPSSEKIIEAICRYHAIDFSFELSQPDDVVQTLMTDLWERENVDVKHTNSKRWGCTRGDSLYQITAEATKDAGQRLSIHDIDPASYFPIKSESTGKIIGCFLVDTYPHPDPEKRELASRRQMYLKEQNQNGEFTKKVIYDSRLFELGKWDDRNPRDRVEKSKIVFLSTLQEPISLPAPISSIPVYLIPNAPVQNATFGRSELAGIETLVAAINQAMTDEDLALAIKGLGIYTTDAPAPKDAAGNPTDWIFGPGRMIERPANTTMEALTGVTSVSPVLDHVNKIDEFMQQGKGIPEIAIGKVDVNVAESGISLQFQLGPILFKGAEKEKVRKSVQDQMFYDIVHQWIPAFEEHTPDAALRCRTVYGDPKPKDNAAIFNLHIQVYELGIYPFQKFADAINGLGFGFDLDATDFQKALDEKKKLMDASTATDPFAERAATEQAALDAGGAPTDAGATA
jgi:hypothetical protein